MNSKEKRNDVQAQNECDMNPGMWKSITLLDGKKLDSGAKRMLNYALQISLMSHLKREKLISEQETDRIFRALRAKYRSEMDENV